jgi:hypothetical protein
VIDDIVPRRASAVLARARVRAGGAVGNVGAAVALAALLTAPLAAQSTPAADVPEPDRMAAGSARDSAGTRTAAGARRQIFPLPVISYAPETKTVGGLALVGVWRRAGGDSTDRPTSFAASALYTQRSQVSADLGVEHWTAGNRWALAAAAQFARYPYEWYGVGNDTPDSAEHYTSRTIGAGVDVRRRVGRALYVGANYEFQQVRMLEVEKGGLLDGDAVVGARGGDVSALGVSTSWDTRDNVYAASRGSFVQLGATQSDQTLGSDFDFHRFTLDARRYVAVGGSRVLALQGVAVVVGGDVPFDQLAQLGGQSVMRGYLQGRYRDRSAVAAQAEFRTPVWRRLGAVAFAGAGQVGPRLDEFSLRDLKPSGGFGLRYALSKDEKMNIRLDFGSGRGSSGTYLTLGEAF